MRREERDMEREKRWEKRENSTGRRTEEERTGKR